MTPAPVDRSGRFAGAARRIVVVFAVAAALTAVVAGSVSTWRPYAWRMFPEASTWEASVVRVTRAGERVDVRDEWPGGYEWGDLVAGSGLERVFVRQPADYGVAVSTDKLAAALDWVAGHTPNDGETVWLEATVRTSHNGRPDTVVTLRSPPRLDGG
jgi:hypothetical protein